ncbi:MAG TPA: DnaJ domain-containing protein [Verrucomicrobiae bacterium]|nr:DnaJ domain-containing protein [Verrucomicrobiae bacterium]
MPDYFALFNEPCRPWLDSDLLKQKFLEASANLHPDKIPSASETEKIAATKKFAELNAAYNCLAEPKSRLLHLLELESGAKPKEIQQIPATLADLFAEVAATCRSADNFLVEKAKATSPLLQVQFFERAQEWIERLNSLQIKLNDLRGQLIDKLKSIDAKWMEANAESKRELLPQLEDIYRLFGYFNRWNSQIQERIVRLQL